MVRPKVAFVIHGKRVESVGQLTPPGACTVDAQIMLISLLVPGKLIITDNTINYNIAN